jgi:hypothetical protein
MELKTAEAREDGDADKIHPQLAAAIELLRAFALRNKRKGIGDYDWRDKLAYCWHSGDYGPYGSYSPECSHLQALRNHPNYGPGSGFLESFKP